MNNGERNKRNNLIGVTATVAAGIILWQAFSSFSGQAFVPGPFKVLARLKEIFIPELAVHLLYSLARIVAGIVLSLIAGVAPGIIMGRNTKFNEIFSPSVYLLYPVPKIALLPLVMLIFGLGETSKVIMIAMIIFFQVLVSTRDCVRSIPDNAFRVMRSLGASGAVIFTKVILPASMPGLLSSVRVSLGTAMSVLFFTETFGTRFGMGYYIMDAWMRVDYKGMFAGIVLLGAAGLVLFKAVDLLERVLCPWKD